MNLIFSNKPLRIVTRLVRNSIITILLGSITAYLRIFMLVEIPYLTSILLIVAFLKRANTNFKELLVSILLKYLRR